MILTGKEIYNEVLQNRICIEPFSIQNINPNSFDISIGTTICFYEENAILDSTRENEFIEAEIPDMGFLLKKNKFYFALSKERINTDYYVPILHNKSGVARKGLFTHITADLLQVKYDGKVMLQLLPFADTIIYPNEPIAQISFWKIFEEGIMK